MRSSQNNPIHPALMQLLRFQRRAKLKKLVSTLKSPRRQLMTVIAVVLGFLWLGQAVVSITFRESADPVKLAIWIPLGLFGYTAWHLLKTVGAKPIEPFEWTPAEQELLRGAPVTGTQMIVYRFASIFQAAVLKAACFSLLMIPDLNFIAAGFVGMLSGLLIVDLFRMMIEIACYSLSKRQLTVARIVLYGGVAFWVAGTFISCLLSPQAEELLASPGAFLFAKHFGQTLIDQITSQSAWLLLPFTPAVNVVLADVVGWGLIKNLGCGFGLITLTCWAVVWCNQIFTSIRKQREQTAVKLLIQFDATNQKIELAGSKHSRKIRLPLRLQGIGSIAWRQFLGAWHYRGTLAISLALPTFLCCLPLMAKHEPFHMLINIVGGLVFYSFLLLPSALLLDFRRDVHRLDVLKSLPISPLAVTLGQLAAPVTICVAFQWVVLTIALSMGAISLVQAMVTAILLIPVGVLIFAMENLIFMFSPYRRNQEGLSVFLRTILTFTAKGVLFGVALAATLVWAIVCHWIIPNTGGQSILGGLLFGTGIWTLTTGAAIVATLWLAKLYRQFDPALDAPAVS